MFIFASWITAATATLGSLFFSEIAEFPPCSLCWYQRIFMYPLVFILLVGLFPLDKLVYKYAAPFAFIGLIISIYHNLLQLEIIPETMAPCLEGIPCSGIYIEWLGFITIPFLSFVAFAIIFTLMIILSRKRNYEK
ncbi:disulfide bond formation protein B [Halobacteriovorax marinus]|uniref:Disulfide bond formation protein B n=1 Tax=Halobacteriovorax marinus TaxID=97084 RepID=A0A1Y5F3U4_9BACT|nr:disulfide bond formation protein B [Halobacteriovorax marinus]